MKIYNLSAGTYKFLNPNLASILDQAISIGMLSRGKCPIANFMFHRFHNWDWSADLNVLLNEVPVFLVETTQSGKNIPVPGTNTTVLVPQDCWADIVDDYNDGSDDAWFARMREKYGDFNPEKRREDDKDDDRDFPPLHDEEDRLKDEHRDRDCKEPANSPSAPSSPSGPSHSPHVEVTDMLGVYIHTSNPGYKSYPVCIFVWIDKIANCAHDDMEAEALLNMVTTHEYCHAFMDVKNYNVTPNPDFDYSTRTYKFIEEALANAYAFYFIRPICDYYQKHCLERFIERQPEGYNEGVRVYRMIKESIRRPLVRMWMRMKVIIDDIAISILDGIDKNKCLGYLSHPMRLRLRTSGIIEIELRTYYMLSLFYSEEIEILNTGKWTSATCDHWLYLSHIPYTPHWRYQLIPRHMLEHFTLYTDNIPSRFEDISMDVLDEDGNLVPPSIFPGYERTVETVGVTGWLAKKVNGKWHIEDAAGNIINKIRDYDSIWSYDSNGLCQVRINGLYGMIDKQGNEIIDVKYDHLSSFENGRAIAKLNGAYGIIDEQNGIIRNFDIHYPDVRGFRNGTATMRDANWKWGVIDYNGKVIIPPTYDSVVVFFDGVAKVELNGKKFKIDEKGNVIP